MPDQPPSPGLAERLASVVSTELQRHRGAIEAGAGARSLHVELEIGRSGQVGEVTFWTEHRIPVRAQLGLAREG